MRLIAAGDLHYGHYPQHDGQTEAMAERVCREGADVLILAGDICSGRPDRFEACLSLFDGFKGRKLLVPGNHDLWTVGGSSLELYEATLPAIAASAGFAYLDRGPEFLDGVAFVGSVGWYDYTLRDHSLGIDERLYEAKEYPGVVRWNDSRFIRWSFTDLEFTNRCLIALSDHLARVGELAGRIICVTHHLPFENMVDRKKSRAWAFCNAYLGSSRMGDLLLRYANVTHLLCGHSHNQGLFRNGHITCVKVGSSYRRKSFTTLEI